MINSKYKISDEYIRANGGKFRYILRTSPLVRGVYYGLLLDVISLKYSRKWNEDVENAIEIFVSTDKRLDKKYVKHLKKDIFKCYRLIKSVPNEYFLLDLENKTKIERKSYVTDAYMFHELSKLGLRKIHDIELNDKENFYELTKKYFKRRLIKVSNMLDYNKFYDLASSTHRIIAKPNFGALGRGIFISETKTKEDIDKVFNKIIEGGGKLDYRRVY